MDRVSGPLLDRIDLQVEVDAVPVEDIVETRQAESSRQVAARVKKARSVQQARYEGEKGIFCNAQLDAKRLKKYCPIDRDSQEILHLAVEKMGMSMRAYSRILKVARTIADLRNSGGIEAADVAEAIQYRSLDGKYWR